MAIHERRDLWEEIWREYDEGRPVSQPAQPVSAPARPAPRRRSRLVRIAGALGLLGLLGTYLAAPFVAAATLGEALARGDAARLEAQVDWARLAPQFAEGLGSQPLSPQADRFLAGMAHDVAQGMATPAGLIGALRDRLPRDAGGFGMIGAVRPLGAREWQVSLHAPGEAEQALSVTLALQDPWRMQWQVVGVQVAPRRADWGL
ncbi:DUF2939 domain-containing protein [Rhodovarius crocodyli]|uniref:DUF2939 domain-containing protein n=1 Tax=Rhodovarius crocodyli TaxID=1979269 RepID=UPI0013E3DEE9|nr:DUF2939 domain-containing protein [Rhodovarius crocodyli]